MTLFTQISPRAQELISQYPDLINTHLEDWIKTEIKMKKGMAKDVLLCLTLAKRRLNPSQPELKLTPQRTNAINKLVKLGHGMEQFKGLIDYMVQKYWGTEWWTPMINPEFLFRPDNFQRYLEEARENHRKDVKKNKPEIGNQYDKLRA